MPNWLSITLAAVISAAIAGVFAVNYSASLLDARLAASESRLRAAQSDLARATERDRDATAAALKSLPTQSALDARLTDLDAQIKTARAEAALALTNERLRAAEALKPLEQSLARLAARSLVLPVTLDDSTCTCTNPGTNTAQCFIRPPVITEQSRLAGAVLGLPEVDTTGQTRITLAGLTPTMLRLTAQRPDRPPGTWCPESDPDWRWEGPILLFLAD